ncbi:C1 family peptidase [Peredibacter sp. HCB2-198]|uniref:C1 family peptidase n=1 Tax=Peredibacter sp. HCB2-198 TaxID=3383025 RepID=UPI0038B41CEF
MKIIIPLVLISFSSFATTLEPVNTDYDYQNAPEYQAIMTKLKEFGDFTKKEGPAPAPAPAKTLSKGEQAVEEAKARNRAIIAAQTKAEKEAVDKNRDMTELQKWKLEEKKTLEAWKKESRDQLNAWKREQEIFLGRIKVYKENTFELPVKQEKIVEKKVPVEVLPDVHIVHSAFAVPVRDQWNRPTCSAFAGVRVVEILLAQNSVTRDLSEQYLYWASKPKCYSSPCSEKGSWITPAYKHSQEQMTVDIPQESECGYNGQPVENNETQLPLKATCKSGVTKILNYSELKTLAETVESLKKNIPVVMAAKLSENFYKNQGLVTLNDAQGGVAKLDAHSMGHAFVGVGVIELPEKLKATEGNYCIVVANSWGKGWGAGGYSCLTENWLTKFRQKSPFVAVNKISVE